MNIATEMDPGIKAAWDQLQEAGYDLLEKVRNLL
jgi:hypothetical protein